MKWIEAGLFISFTQLVMMEYAQDMPYQRLTVATFNTSSTTKSNKLTRLN